MRNARPVNTRARCQPSHKCVLNQIPGYDSALAGERKDRAKAFLSIGDEINGIRVEDFTPLRWEWLRAFDNAFVCGGTVDEGAIWQFVFCVHRDFTFEEMRAKLPAFISEHAPWDFDLCRVDIGEYLDRAFLDAPGGVPRKPIVSVAASLGYQMSGEPFRWDVGRTLREPIAKAYQLIKARNWMRGEIVTNSRSDKVVSDWQGGLIVLTKPTREELLSELDSMARDGFVAVEPAPQPNCNPGNLGQVLSWSISVAKRATGGNN